MDKKNLSKRSQGHVEVVISFILFVGFLIAIFIFINPFAKAQDTTVVTNYVNNIIMQKITTTINVLSIIVNNSDDDCYDFNVIIANFNRNYVEVQDPINPRKYTLYFSDMFQPGSPSCAGKPGLKYKLGVYTKENFVVNQSVQDLKDHYIANYNDLKDSLKINSDFSFGFMDYDRKEITDLSVAKKIPSGDSVIAKESPVTVLNSDGTTKNLILSIKVW